MLVRQKKNRWKHFHEIFRSDMTQGTIWNILGIIPDHHLETGIFWVFLFCLRGSMSFSNLAEKNERIFLKFSGLAWTWSDLNSKKIYSTKYIFVQSTITVSQDYWYVRRPILRYICIACIRATNEVSRYTMLFHYPVFLFLLALKFGDEYAVMVRMILKKKRYFELTGPVDNETESTCDSRYNCQHFHRLFCGLERFTCKIISAEDNYCIWILHTESGVDYIVCEL